MDEQNENDNPKPKPKPTNVSVAMNNLGCVLLWLITCATITIIFMTLSGVFS